MKTLIIFFDYENPQRCVMVDGDYSHFNGVAINGKETEWDDHFWDWMYDEEGAERPRDWSKNVTGILEGKAWDKVAYCAYLP